MVKILDVAITTYIGGCGGASVRSRGGKGFPTGDLVTKNESHDVRSGDHKITAGEEDDGPLGILESRGVNEESQDGEERGGGAYDGPK